MNLPFFNCKACLSCCKRGSARAFGLCEDSASFLTIQHRCSDEGKCSCDCMSRLDEAEKSSLHQLITDRVEQPVKADRSRKALQDFSRMESFLTEALWGGLRQLSFSDAADQLMQHLYRLGLRNPTDRTFATMTALLLLFGLPKTPYQMHCTLTSVIQSWRSRLKRLEKSIPLSTPAPPHILICQKILEA